MKSKTKNILLISFVIFILIGFVAFIVWFGMLQEISYQARPSELIIDTNKDCDVAVDTPWWPTAQQTCVWEGHLDAPENAESLSFFISIRGNPNIGTSKKSFKLEVWGGSNWEELFYKELIAIQDTQETTFGEIPGDLIICDKDVKKCYYACDDEHPLPPLTEYHERKGWTYICIEYPNCLNLPREGCNRYFCTMPKITLDKKYIIDGQVKFRTSATLLQGSGNIYMGPIGSGAISVYGVVWEVLPTTTIYRLENNICNKYIILESERLESDYDSLSECQENIVIGGCGTVTPGLQDTCCQNLGYDYWDEDTLSCKNYIIDISMGACTIDEDCKEFAEVVCDDGSLWYHDYHCIDKKCVISLDIPPESCIETGRISCFYVVDDECKWGEFKQADVPDRCFKTRAECEESLEIGIIKHIKVNWVLYLILGGVGLLFLIVIILLVIRYRKK